MGRAGAGGGGHSHSSSSSHRSSSHSTSSMHRVSSSRPSMGTSRGPSSIGGFNSSPTINSRPKPSPPPPPPPKPKSKPHHDHGHSHMPPPPPPVINTYPRRTRPLVQNTYINTYTPPVRQTVSPTVVNNSYTGSSYNTSYEEERDRKRNNIAGWIIFFILIALIIAIALPKSSRSVNSTIAREKLTDIPPYWTENVIDELDWINNPTKLSAGLKEFYNKTGIQPYIYLKSYDSMLWTDEDKDAWAGDYFENVLYARGYSNAMLYVYFAEENQDEDVGLMVVRCGPMASEIMDSEALEIFWNFHDSDWDTYDENDTDNMYIDVFTRTGNKIMKRTTTSKDVAVGFIVLFIIAAVCVFIYNMVVFKRNAEKERAEETERILNASMNDLAKNSTDNDLLNKYK